MDLSGLVADAVALANEQTDSLQVDIAHEAFLKVDGNTKPVYDDPVVRRGFVTQTSRWVRGKDDTVRQARFQIAILSSVAIDVRDRLTFDGRTGPILDVKAFQKPNGGGYITEVTIG
jgi:hypothetical protein